MKERSSAQKSLKTLLSVAIKRGSFINLQFVKMVVAIRSVIDIFSLHVLSCEIESPYYPREINDLSCCRVLYYCIEVAV